jgi:hypothetical protein
MWRGPRERSRQTGQIAIKAFELNGNNSEAVSHRPE